MKCVVLPLKDGHYYILICEVGCGLANPDPVEDAGGRNQAMHII